MVRRTLVSGVPAAAALLLLVASVVVGVLLSDAGGGPTLTLTPTPLAADPGGGAAVTTAAAAVAPVPGASDSTAPASDPPVTVSVVPDLLARQPRLATMTIHRYPLRNCYVPPRSPQYPTVSHLLSSGPDRERRADQQEPVTHSEE